MEMKPGRELDAIIAEKVMGCAGVDQFSHICTCEDSGHNDHLDRADGVKEYSTDIAAAWDVADNMRAIGFSVKLFAYVRNEVFCELTDEKGRSFHSEPAVTPAHAICLAALKAVGS